MWRREDYRVSGLMRSDWYQDPQEFSYIKQVLGGALAACEQAGYSLLLRPITEPENRLLETIQILLGSQASRVLFFPFRLLTLATYKCCSKT